MSAPDSPLVWTEDGQPRSRLYGDVYFSASDGLGESRAVFLEGCGLPDAWTGRARFVVGELGFGTGLNIAALLELWRRTRPPGGVLHVFSVEAHPLEAAEAARALAAWPELAEVAALMTERWPGRARGFHRVEFPELGAILDLAVMEVGEALGGWAGTADAWFLDGFSPVLNAAMWSPETLALVGARSAPGARAATFTVAGDVRRGLAAAGFAVEKRPGFGRKRERLEARRAGTPSERRLARAVTIIGGGIAGASAARAVRALGGEAVVLDPGEPGASGFPAALVTPRLDAGLGPLAALFAQAFGRAVALYEDMPAVVIARGVLQYAIGERDPERFAKIAASDFFEPGALALADAGLDQRSALVIEPAAVLAAWLGAVEARPATNLGDGPVIVAAGLGSAALVPGLPLQAVRGQADRAEGITTAAAAWGGYVLPTRNGLMFGATHDRDDERTDVRATDTARNLETLAGVRPELAAQLALLPLRGRAAVRAVTPDRLPLAGAAPGGEPGVFVLAGFGSRGFSTAPLLAEHVAALALGAPSPLPAPLAALADPGRFARRAARRRNS